MRRSRGRTCRSCTPEPELAFDEVNLPGRRWVRLRLQNDGVGVALDVRFRLEAADVEWTGDVSPSVRAMRPAEVVPPEPDTRDHPMLSSERKTGLRSRRPLPRRSGGWW